MTGHLIVICVFNEYFNVTRAVGDGVFFFPKLSHFLPIRAFLVVILNYLFNFVYALISVPQIKGIIFERDYLFPAFDQPLF